MRNRSENQINVIFIRHGATESNTKRRYIGKTDESLSKEGMSALYDARRSGAYPEVEYVFISPMKRCVETSRILYPDIEPVIIKEWREIDFGAFEGKNYVELQGDIRYQKWIDSNGILPFPEGESRESFNSRCSVGLHKMVQLLSDISIKHSNGYKCPSKYETVGVIAHGGTIMSLLSQFGGGEYFDYQVPNGGGYVCTLEMENDRFRLKILEQL